MSKSTRGIRAAGVASLAVSLSIGVAAPAFAVPGFEFDRIGGADRYETAALVADEYGVRPDAIIANGQPGFYADALASNYLSGVQNAPILLTKIKGLPQATLDQLDQMNAQNVTVVGGEGVVPAEQAQQLRDAGYNVTRIAGDDRFETNADVIAAGGNATDGLGLIATGFNFPDALAAGPFAYNGHSLGLSTKDDVKDVVLDALKADGVTEVLIFGGTDAVGPGVVADLATRGITVRERFAGADRSETSELAAEWALANLGFTNKHVGVASGYTEGYGADALAGGPLEGRQDAPILITRDVENPDDVIDYLEAHNDTLETGHIFGGPAAVSAAAEAQMTEAAQGAPTTNQDFTVDQAAATNEVSAAAPDENRGRRTYSFSGLDDTKTYDVAVYPAEYVTVDDNGVVSFRDTEGTSATTDDNNVADFTATSAVIERVNNADYNDGLTNGTALDVAPVNGVITVTVDSTNVDEVRPVLFLDADNGSLETAPDLDLDASDQPTELFAVGGQKSWIAPQAASGDAASTPDGRVTSLNKAGNDVTIDKDVAATVGDYNTAGGDWRYIYDANDNFTIGGTPATMDEFEAALSRGDGLEVGAYSQNSALVSSFNIVDGPLAPTSVEAEKGGLGSENDITVTVDFAEPATDTMYQQVVIERAPVTGGTDELADGTVGAYAPVATVAIADDEDALATTFTWTDENVAVGSYRYRAAGVIDGDQGGFTADDANETSVAPTLDTTGPLAIDNVITANDGLVGTFDGGDVFKVVFNETVGAPASGDTIRAEDGDATVADFVNGTNATFALNTAAETVNGVSRPAGRVLTVTLTAAPTVITAGTTAGLQIPATVTDQSGTADAAGNRWNIGDANQDLVIDQDSVDNQNDSTDTTAPGVTTSGATAASGTVTFVADEALQSSSVQAADFTGNDGGDTGTDAPTITGATLGADGKTITVTFTGAGAADTIVMGADTVLDLAGNSGPPAAVTATLT